jgi:hypothetical protein
MNSFSVAVSVVNDDDVVFVVGGVGVEVEVAVVLVLVKVAGNVKNKTLINL